MRKRIKCKFHQDDTASLVQYGANWFCYGACRKRYTNDEVEKATGETYEYSEESYEQEDLQETFQYIDSLPKKEIRGLQLPTDTSGYYVCWPDRSYYKYRPFNPTHAKYIGPGGHSVPLFWASKAGLRTLAVAEGEINALSIARALPEWDVCSPGSASMFNATNLSKYLTQFKSYSTVVVVLDHDAAGTKALIEAKAFFLYKIPFVRYLQLKSDCNEILVQEGPRALRARLQGENS